MGSVTHFLYTKLVVILGSFLFSVSRFLLPLFSFISSFLFRLNVNGDSFRKSFDHSEFISEEINQKDSNFIEPEPDVEAKADDVGFTDSEDDTEGKKLEFSFTFRFPTFDEFSESEKQNNELFNYDSVSSTSYSRIIEKPEVLTFNAERADSLQEKYDIDDHTLSDKNLEQVNAVAAEILDEPSKEKSVNAGVREEEETEETNFIVEKGEPVTVEQNSLGDYDLPDEVQFNPEKDSSITTDYDSDSINFEHVVSVMSSDGFLSDGDFGGEFEVDDLMGVDVEKLEYSVMGKDDESGDFDEEDSDIMNELSKLEEQEGNNRVDISDAMASQFLSEEDFDEDSNENRKGEFDGKDDKPMMAGSYDYEKLTSSKETYDFGDSNKLETLWEHQDLIEQLKMELRKVRATGLPTILEESESPKMEDLKPWKIDEKFQHEDCMDELHKFYKSYSERMRKFDIFNYQKMYAIGFLQLKDPLQPISSPKTSGPTLKSLLSQNLWQLKHRSSDSEPMIQFMKELQSDLEGVYVGQMCLSWEFLHWQYGKALDLWDSDPRGIHRYNEVAGEFQQFQVLMQRFIEDEHFQGPRVQYYIKRRCVLRNLLQVPVIKEDNLKDRRKGRRGETAEYAITSDMLVEIMEESVRIFWRFVRADKDCSTTIAKGHKGTSSQLQNPGDLQLLMEAKRILHKKERKLKDVVRSGNCWLKRFRKCREDDSDHVLYFFSQLDMKLVTRVLNMTRITTDQLVWCHSKLNKISFENRKIQVEPSFLLFPC